MLKIFLALGSKLCFNGVSAMATERRHHRAPLTTDGSLLRGRNGLAVAACVTPQVAHFLKVCANSFDDLTEALDLCRGEIDLDELERISPAISRIRALREEVEKQLRGNTNNHE